MKSSFFVDDFICGAPNYAAAQKIATEATTIAAEAGMPLRRWRTNDPKLQGELLRLQPEDIEKTSDTLEFQDDEMKVLGTGWRRSSDSLGFSTNALIEYCNSVRHRSCLRTVLSVAAHVYDLLGLISPVTIAVRILMQSIWMLRLKWDEEVPAHIKQEFWSWVDQLHRLSDIKVPRWYESGLEGEPTSIQLHVFCDASTRAYGAVGYLRTEDSQGRVAISLVSSRARVATLKGTTLPRLELLGAHLAITLAKVIKTAMQTPMLTTFYWIDSQVSLAWIKGDPGRWKQYVSNRVRYIQEHSTSSEWHFVAGKENPADLCSRGVGPADLADPSCEWWTGPPWLSKGQSTWPIGINTCPDGGQVNTERKKVSFVLPARVAAPSTLFNEERYGALRPVLRMTAHIQRMFGNGIADRLDRPNLRRIGPLSAFELQLAKQLWMRQLQTEAFAEEIKSLETTGKVNKNSVIAAFHPYLDEEDGLIKLRSRIRLSLCLQATVDLPLLPGRNEDNNKVPHFITLLVREAHRRVMHAGLRDTLSELRQEAWILRGRQIVKGILAKCACCNRMNSRPYDQPTAPLPMDRCTSAPPFDVTGVDFAGPLYIRGSKKKSWICLFTCGVVRAVHLELVMSLTARCFLMAIERFVSRFGVCRVIYSDNAKTFKRADKDLATLWKKAEPEILQEIAHKGIQWKFIAEGAPWWGGDSGKEWLEL